MTSKVKVCANEQGLVIVPSPKNPSYGHIRVEQVRTMIDDTTGFARQMKLSALIPGEIETLKGFGWKAGQEVSGKVYFKESLEPFNTREPERDYKRAGKTGIVCCVDGSPIYRKNFFSMVESTPDQPLRDPFTGELITHDNKEAIRAAYRELSESLNEMNPDLGKA